MLPLAAVVLLAACSTKDCRCYVLESCTAVRISKTRVDKDMPCRELGYDKPHPSDGSFRYCTDWDTAEISDRDIARMFDNENDNKN